MKLFSNKSIIGSGSHCSCSILVLISYYLDTYVMVILILIDVQHSQKAAFSFEKVLNRQNHFSSGSLHLAKNPSQQNFRPRPIHPPHTHTPSCHLENPGGGAQDLFKTLNFDNNCLKTRNSRYQTFLVLSNFTEFLVPNIFPEFVV